MHKLFSAGLLIAVLFAFLPSVYSPSVQAAQAVGTVPLTDCPFSVGIGAAKHSIAARCGVLAVPEDRKNTAGRTLDIHFVVLAALNPDAKGLPIFHLEGGPGASAIQNFGQAWFSAYRLLRQEHPVVLIDQRGTGISASLQCTEITDAALPDLGKLTSAKDDQALGLKRLNDCLTRLSKTTDPQFYTSAALADDTDAVRAALGYDQIDVFGNSYGTSLGQIYLGRHGEHVAAMVLDSVAAPWNQWVLDGPNNGQAALDKLFALCKTDPACDKAYPDLPGQLQKALDLLKQKPVVITGNSAETNAAHPVGMTAERFQGALFQLLYNSANSNIIPQAISQATRGDYTLVASILITLAEHSGDVSLGLYSSIICSEMVAFYTDALLQQYQKDNVFNGLDDSKESCKAWRSAELDPAEVAPVKSERPVLILSGGLDPITPVKFGEETHNRLSHSTLVVLPFQAHGVIVNSKCAQTITAAFLSAPDQAIDTSCVTHDLRPLFTGTYSVELASFNDPKATFTGVAPKGWTAQQDGALTFFTSPDGLQFVAAGVYKGQKPDAVKAALLTQLGTRYGTLEVQQELTINLLFISITSVVHTLDRPDQTMLGVIFLRPQGSDTYVVWQAAPANWFQAVSLSIAPQMLGTLRPR